MASEAPQQPAPASRSSPWPARVVGGITVVSIIAILLVMFLPRERREVAPVGESPQTEQYAATPTPAPGVYQTPPAQQRPAQQPQEPPAATWTPQPAPEQTPSHTAPDTPAPQQPAPTPPPAPAPAPTPQPTPSPAPQPAPTPAPQPAPTPQPQPTPAPQPAPTPAPQPTPSATPTPAPRPAPAPTPQPAPQPAPSRPAPQPAPEPAPRAAPLFTPAQAQAVVRQAEGNERAVFLGAIAELEKPPHQDEEWWELQKMILGPALVTAFPQGLHRTTAQDAVQAIYQSRNGREAAARLRAIGHRSPMIPTAIQQRLVQALATATNYQEAKAALDQVQQQSPLTPQTYQMVQGAIARQAGARR